MRESCKDFIVNFDIVDNALNMRTLHRWNGRDLHNRENLSEHTHLVMSCLIKIIETFMHKNTKISDDIRYPILFKAAMIHDSLELYRGDILSITKDDVPGLRDLIDEEEYNFMEYHVGKLTYVEKLLIRIADMMACYKFIEYELRNPVGKYAKIVYDECKHKYETVLNELKALYDVTFADDIEVKDRFVKGYKNDAGTDVILDRDVTILPLSTDTINLHVKVTPKPKHMAILCARTSAANKGLIVATCPIDPDYTGDVTAIVHNVSNDIITYKKGEAFCQVVMMPIVTSIDAKVKKKGKRTSGKLGSTGI